MKTRTILLVDDDDDDQSLFQEALNDSISDYRCEFANTGVEALQYFEAGKLADLIFLDISMPSMNGVECLKQLKKNPLTKTVPVVIFSTADDFDSIYKMKKLGADMYFGKPTSYKVLQQKLEEILKLDFSDIQTTETFRV